jgi:UDP-N-acetylmuramate dehydrogenase
LSRSLDWFFDHSKDFLGELRREEPLQRHTYYRIGGPAAVMAIPRGEADLRWLKQGIDASGCQWVVLGLGSNLLISDHGFSGLVIKTSRLDQGIEPAGDGLLRTGCSVAVSSLLRRAAQEGWGGFECLAGVPGSIGGVVVMNAGTHLGEARDRIEQVESFDLATRQDLEKIRNGL